VASGWPGAGRQRGGHIERDHGAGGDVTCGGDPDDSPARLALLLWILVIGFLGLAGWRLVQAAVRRLNLTEGHRVRALVYGIGYAIAFLSTLMFVVHGTKPAAGDSSARDYTAHVLSLDGGRVIVAVAVAGIVLVALGVVMAVWGFGADVTRHLRMGWMSRGTQDAVVRLGQAGYVARAMVIAGIGIAALDAAITYDAAKAKGVDGVLRCQPGSRRPDRPARDRPRIHGEHARYRSFAKPLIWRAGAGRASPSRAAVRWGAC
jgi:hypothetical protein